MATFIPEWIKVSARFAHIKRSLNALGDEYVVRRPIRQATCPADFFIEHHLKGWLAIAVEDTPFSAIDSSSLFKSDKQVEFERRLESLEKQANTSGIIASKIEVLVLMWACSDDEVQALKKVFRGQYCAQFVSRDQFKKLGEKLIERLLSPIQEEARQWILGTHFPEAEIPLPCTTRRFFQRDNSAKLPRFFLDHEQEWASKLDFEIPEEQANTTKDFSVRLVNGVAGSGKTLIVINRALLLAEEFPTQKLLILIHNTPVVADIKDRLYRSRGGLPGNLEISTFFSWTCRQWKAVFNKIPQMPESGSETLPDQLHKAREAWPDLKLTDEQLIEEVNFINDTLILDEDAYLAFNRMGRGFALRSNERVQVWAIYESVKKALQKLGLRMWSELPREICFADQAQERLHKYHHILVDEAQFFAPSWFQLVKLSMEPDSQLFLCADPNQGFMKNRLSWKSVGLHVAGRTKKLHKSYRTTRAILEAASGVLALLDQGDSEDYLKPDLTHMDAGVRPVLIYTDSPQDAMDRLVNEVIAIHGEEDLSLNAQLVIYGERVQKSDLYKQLCAQIGKDNIWWFNEKNQKKEPRQGYGKEYLRMAYLDTATGLEGSVVFLIGMENMFAIDLQEVGKEEEIALREERARKLYMAMTRAGQRLIVISSQKLPATMEKLFDQLPDQKGAPTAVTSN